MGMDGLSIANTGAVKELTSADYQNRTEQIVQLDQANDIKQVQTINSHRRVQEKDESEEDSKKKHQDKPAQNEQEEFHDGLSEQDELQEYGEEVDTNEYENPNKDFYVKLNSKDDIIELYDSKTNKLVETISSTELSELVKKLNMVSGIFVNKEV